MASPAAASRMAIKTFNKLNAAGLARFDPAIFRIAESSETNAHAILLRSHKLTESDVPIMCRSIARCGAGTNNCNVGRMTELGVPVFNTPGANANSVKELVLCACVPRQLAPSGAARCRHFGHALVGKGSFNYQSRRCCIGCLFRRAIFVVRTKPS